MENDKLVRMSDVERWILTESACIDTPADRDAVVERMRYAIPAVDAVEVCRCRECRHRFNRPICVCKGDDWFCGYGQRREDGLYESLKRGLKEAIAFENGEIECRTETREDGDGDG